MLTGMQAFAETLQQTLGLSPSWFESEAEQLDEDNVEDARVVIYLTDGFGEFPDHEPPTPTLWVTYGLSESRFPFGETISLTEILKAQQ